MKEVNETNCSGVVKVFSPIIRGSVGKRYPFCPYMENCFCGVFDFNSNS